MNETVTAVRVCPFCNNPTKINIDLATDIAYLRYSAYGIGYIQDIPVPQFSNERCKAIVREFLKTGYCLDCQQLIFGGKKSHYKEVKAYKG